jgi:hypothetical protein
MAFNPFTTFQKNQKFWMAAILLICMITFVFCTGTGGDMQDRIINIFRGRGTTVMSVDGHNLSLYDLSRLRDERVAVNQYMQRACRMTLDNIAHEIQKIQKEAAPADEKADQKRKQDLVRLGAMHGVLVKRLAKPRYFEGGVKLDDLAEFKLWQAQADRLNIRLREDDVELMVYQEFFQFILPTQLREARVEAFRGKDLNDATARRAILEEFRVRLARMALLVMRPSYFVAHPQPPVIPDAVLPNEDRVPVTLADLWDIYKKQRSEFDVTLIPIHVADQTKELKDPPEAALAEFFEKYRKNHYDPDSPLPSFQSPEEVKVEFLMGDPKSPIYPAAARAEQLLLTTLPLAGNLLNSPLVTAARYGAGAGMRLKSEQDQLDAMGVKRFDDYGGALLSATDVRGPMASYLASREPKAVASLVGNVMASMGGPAALTGAPAWMGFRAFPETSQSDILDAGMAAEAKSRAVPYAKVAVSGMTGVPFNVLTSAMLNLHQYPVPMHSIHPGRQVLPLPVIAPELDAVLEDRAAEQWASTNLRKMKQLIDDNNKTETIKTLIKEYVDNEKNPQKNLNLTHVVTKDYYNQFDIHKAPELQPLREQYEKYYNRVNWYEKRDVTPDKMLKEGDFYKLFFDSGEPLITSNRPFTVRPWPPSVTPSQLQVMALPGQRQLDLEGIPEDELAAVQRFMQQLAPNQQPVFNLLDEAQKPILYWQRGKKPAALPEKLADARGRVLDAWRLEQAREQKALELAKSIATVLRDAGGDYDAGVLRRASDQAMHKPIVLKNLAPLAPKLSGDPLKRGTRIYGGYHLPKDTIARPRDSMVDELLSLYDLKAPIEIQTKLLEGGAEPTYVKVLNDLNKELYDKVKKEKDPKGQFVQVLTNKPQTIYYVAVVSRRPNPYDKAQRDDFMSALRYASEQSGLYVDTFAERAQQMLATSFHKQLVDQMKAEFNYTGPTDAETRQSFDRDDHGS